MTGTDDGNGHSKDGKYKVGYRRPPLHSRFEAGTSGNPKGRPKQSKARNIREDLEQVYLQPISIGNGRLKRTMSAVVVLYEKLLRDALNGNAKAAGLVVKLAGDLGIMHFKDKAVVDYSVLTSEERELMNKTLPIIQKLKATKS
jgi:hypothetical protein